MGQDQPGFPHLPRVTKRPADVETSVWSRLAFESGRKLVNLPIAAKDWIKLRNTGDPGCSGFFLHQHLNFH